MPEADTNGSENLQIKIPREQISEESVHEADGNEYENECIEILKRKD